MDHGVCFRAEGGDIWIVKSEPSKIDLAFSASDRTTVDRFYEAAMRAGGADNGAPGVRTSLSRELLRCLCL